jgi:hypothetical protein
MLVTEPRFPGLADPMARDTETVIRSNRTRDGAELEWIAAAPGQLERSQVVTAVAGRCAGPLLCCVAMMLISAVSGCASHADRVWIVREEYHAGRLDVARESVDKQLKRHKGEADVFLLDKAMIELSSGRPKEAEQILRGVRDRFDDYEQKDAGEVTLSMLTDDNAQAYSGEDYEKVLVRAMLALSNLMTDGKDSGAYALQMVDKQQQITQKATEKQKKFTEMAQSKHEGNAAAHPESGPPFLPAELAYKQVALGPYIRAMLAEESPLTLDEAARARVQVASFEPNFRDANADLQRAQYETPIAPGRGVLYVFALVGRGPIKQEKEEIATQVSLLIADRIVNAFSNRAIPPTLAPVKVPQVINFPSVTEGVSVRVDGLQVGTTATIVDVGAMAERQQQAHYPEVIARAVARRVLKKGVLYAAQEVADVQQGGLLSVGVMAAGVAWEATENADTRCWALLPDTIQVLRVELPVGEHEILLRPMGRGGEMSSTARTKVEILDGRNTYLLGTLPTTQFVGKLLTSGDKY